MKSGNIQWRLYWDGDQLLDPGGSLCSTTLPTASDQLLAHSVVDDWSAELKDHFPKFGQTEAWWFLRFPLYQNLVTGLPQARMLSQMIQRQKERPSTVLLRNPPVPGWADLLRCFLPDAQIKVKSQGPDPVAESINWNALFLLRAVTSFSRHKQLAMRKSSLPRVLVLSRDRTWNGNRETELDTVIDGLRAAELEPVVMAPQSGSVAMRLRGLRTRPSDHLFAEQLRLWNQLRLARTSYPSFVAPDRLFNVDGLDMTEFVVGILRSTALAYWKKQSDFLAYLPGFAKDLNIRAAVLSDENNGNTPFKLAFKKLGIPTVAVQHGVIHQNHLSYICPSTASPEAVTLCDKTCVYGSSYADLLVNSSIYRDENISITGQVQMDHRFRSDRSMESHAVEGQRVRNRVLPSGCDRLLLFTSQPPNRSTVGPALLRLLANSSRRNFLVVRPHPIEIVEPFWHELIASFGLEQRVAVQKKGALEDWVLACDVHVSSTSTVLAEAAALGRPNLVIDFDCAEDPMATVEFKVARFLSDFASLDDALDFWLCSDFARSDEREMCRRNFVSQSFHKLDGHVGNRVAREVATLVRNR